MKGPVLLSPKYWTIFPPGPRGIVVNHLAEDVRRATRGQGISYIYQPETNGTGGALLAARSFLESVASDHVVITMGDVPLIRATTYQRLLGLLARCDLALLAFEPRDQAQYGMLEMVNEQVTGIVEWKYWKDFSPEKRSRLRYCNAGVYASSRPTLLRYMDKMKPHTVEKQRNGELTVIHEYFLTDIAELMAGDGLRVGMTLAPEQEVGGVDTPESLEAAQKLYAAACTGGDLEKRGIFR